MPEVIWGINPVSEALKARPDAFKEIIITHPSCLPCLPRMAGRTGAAGEKIPKGLNRILQTAREKHIKTTFKDRGALTNLVRSHRHQDIVAILEEYQYAKIEDIINLYKSQKERALIIILDGIEDPQNMGSLIRSAYVAGVHGVIIPKHRAAPVTASVNKASAGALEYTLVARVTNLASTIDYLKKQGIWIIGTTMEAERTIYELDLRLDVAFIVGSEGRGIRPLIKKNCDFLVSIPMKGKISSLNVAVAGAIALFEAVRQRQFS